jgi:hypothetical protein
MYKLSKETTEIRGPLTPYGPHAEACRMNLQPQQPRQNISNATFNRQGTKPNTFILPLIFQKRYWTYVKEMLGVYLEVGTEVPEVI